MLAAILAAATPSMAAALIHSYDVDKIKLGDSVKKVTKILGEPSEVVSKELAADGKEQLTWRYDMAPSRPRTGNPFTALGSFLYMPPRVDEYGMYHQGSLVGGIVGEDAGQAARNRQAYFNTPQGQAARAQAQSTAPPPSKETCTVVFVGRKVTSIKKQQAAA